MLNIGEIRIETRQLTLKELLKREYNLEYVYENIIGEGPRFWSARKSFLFIELLLLRVPMQPIISSYQKVEGDSDYRYYLLDGVQRFCLLRGFINNEYPLLSIEFLKEYENMFFKDLPNYLKRRLDETLFTVYEQLKYER